MEIKEVYMTPQQVDDLRAKVNAIEGLAEIRAALKDEKKTVGDIDELRAKYPRAAVYLEAERWISTTNPVKIRLGSRAMEKILNGEAPDTVLHFMSLGLDAFNLAQEG